MAAVAVTYNLDNPEGTPLGGDRFLVTGEFTVDTGDYATGGTALAASSLNGTTIERVIMGGSGIARTHAYWVKSTGKWKVFVEDAISGIEAEHGASAMTAASYPFIAVVRKAA